MRRLIALVVLAAAIFVGSAVLAGTGSVVRIETLSTSPAVNVATVRLDRAKSTIAGNLHLRVGYAAPWSTRVHVYALDRSGRVVTERCVEVGRERLARSTRLPGKGRGAFTADLGSLRGIHAIRVVGERGRDRC